MVSRRRILGGMLAVGCAGCSSLDPTSDANSGSVANLLGSTLKSRKPPSVGAYPFSAQQIHDLPYATLGVRVGDHPGAVMVLATVEGRRLRWASADRVVFTTEGGWLTATRGLQRDLSAVRWLQAGAGDPLSQALGGSLPAPGVYREMDLRHANEQGLAVTSRFEAVGDEVIEILGVQRPVRRIDEIADVHAWRWQARNSYWVDPQNGRVWRSRQHYCPEMPPIELEVLKPATA